MGLKEYKKKRNFQETSEPDTDEKKSEGNLSFVVQRHHASHLHYDFRLEMEGVLKSWAVPKGPSLNPKDKRLAMMVEDHPYDYRTFEGVIPEGNYGAGLVTIFDEGTYESLGSKNHEKELKKGLYAGNLKFRLFGKILRGEFALVKLKGSDEKSWLLIKHRDEYAVDKQFDSEDLIPEKVKKRGLDRKKLAKVEKSKAYSEEADGLYKPMVPQFSKKMPDGDGWIFEEKLKGQRLISHTGDNHRILSEDGVDVSEEFVSLTKALSSLDKEAVIDGVLVDGKKYIAFDLLSLNGHDTRGLELIKRKELLKALLADVKKDSISYLGHSTDGDKLKPSKKDVSGFIAKESSSVYENGSKSKQWLEISIADSFQGVEKKASPSPSKKMKNMAQETEFPDEKEEDFGKKKLKLTNLNKFYWKNEKIKKGDLIEYYRNISDHILPYLKDRPLSLNRHPNGIDGPNFFQKDLDTDQIPSWIKYQPMFSESNNKDIDYLICNDLPTLLWMANLGCIEINPWLSTYKRPENPTYAVLDLDPNDVDDFDDVVRVALTARDILKKMGIRPFIKTSGSRGLHIFINVGARYDYEVVKNFVNFLGKLILEQYPDLTSLERSPSKRKKKIYLDFLQNRRGQTIAAPYSARPKPGATVSTPLAWEEVVEGLDIKQFTIFNILDRIKEKGDLWKDITSEKTDLKRALEMMNKA
ncbi:non-homologous end-joining DNA ligase [Desertivirga xinjiangensis]|uniref:non-homologous end-joining DNA ligase n=1 Tax=Desertivirga xinjiangensis TaxID=539206 RepID=UPI00210C2476|nr:non-homologous end-joining DNA ligase [Pedobacter xinjiangensis]